MQLRLSKPVLIFSLSFLLIDCKSNVTKVPLGDTQARVHKTALSDNTILESFDAFFKKFKSDSAFQISRVTFPLKSTTIDMDEGTNVKFIKKGDWQYSSLSNHKLMFNILKKNDNDYNVVIQKEDAGINVTYKFLRNLREWHLVGVIDESD